MNRTAINCRVATKEQANTFEEQQNMLADKLNEDRRIKTVICFNDGTQRELGDNEIRMIFDSFLRGEKYIMIGKPPKGHNLEEDYLRRKADESREHIAPTVNDVQT